MAGCPSSSITVPVISIFGFWQNEVRAANKHAVANSILFIGFISL
ncbi:hypothetical protein [Bacteroides faecalis]|nr:hypothetical protein [Bacteroides faecalis]